MIDKRLELILTSSKEGRSGGGQSKVEKLLRRAWKNRGVQCRGINWQRNSLEELISISRCVGGPTLFTILSALAKDYRRYASGMPDLFLWNVQRKESKLVEVKGPN